MSDLFSDEAMDFVEQAKDEIQNKKKYDPVHLLREIESLKTRIQALEKNSNMVSIDHMIEALNNIKKLPAPVTEWQVEKGFDHDDDPAVRVRVILTDDEVEFEKRNQLRDIVNEVINGLVSDSTMVYVRFGGTNEDF